jgi:hypothetical protein
MLFPNQPDRASLALTNHDFLRPKSSARGDVLSHPAGLGGSSLSGSAPLTSASVKRVDGALKLGKTRIVGESGFCSEGGQDDSDLPDVEDGGELLGEDGGELEGPHWHEFYGPLFPPKTQQHYPEDKQPYLVQVTPPLSCLCGI